ncbi:MAG: PQQ-binding-like beta-propeller repeat protein [Actinomycetota bacterium]
MIGLHLRVLRAAAGLFFAAGVMVQVAPAASAGRTSSSDWLQPDYNSGRTNANDTEDQFGAAEAADLELISEVRFPNLPLTTPIVVDGDLVAYVKAGSNWSEDLGFGYRLTRLDGETGQVVWRWGVGHCVHLHPHITSDVVVAGSTGCSQSDPGGQSSANASTGSGGWGAFHTNWTAVHDGRVFFAHGPWGAFDDPLKLEALDASTGERLWRKSLRDRGDMMAAGSNLYMRIGPRIIARSIQDGTVLWKVMAPDGGALDIATPDVLFFQTASGVVAMSTSSRAVLWQAPGHLDAVLAGQAFIGTPDGLVARSVANGALQWTNPNYFGASAAADGVVYSGDSTRRTTVALRASDGAFLDSVIGGSPIVANARLYVTTGRVVRGYA